MIGLGINGFGDERCDVKSCLNRELAQQAVSSEVLADPGWT